MSWRCASTGKWPPSSRGVHRLKKRSVSRERTMKSFSGQYKDRMVYRKVEPLPATEAPGRAVIVIGSTNHTSAALIVAIDKGG